jgi:hypothetical protein
MPQPLAGSIDILFCAGNVEQKTKRALKSDSGTRIRFIEILISCQSSAHTPTCFPQPHVADAVVNDQRRT